MCICITRHRAQRRPHTAAMHMHMHTHHAHAHAHGHAHAHARAHIAAGNKDKLKAELVKVTEGIEAVNATLQKLRRDPDVTTGHAFVVFLYESTRTRWLQNLHRYDWRPHTHAHPTYCLLTYHLPPTAYHLPSTYRLPPGAFHLPPTTCHLPTCPPTHLPTYPPTHLPTYPPTLPYPTHPAHPTHLSTSPGACQSFLDDYVPTIVTSALEPLFRCCLAYERKRNGRMITERTGIVKHRWEV